MVFKYVKDLDVIKVKFSGKFSILELGCFFKFVIICLFIIFWFIFMLNFNS